MGDVWEREARVLGRYVLREVAGRGGQGTVWDATDLLTRQRVAVKKVRRGEVRYETTALMAARFPGMVELLDQGEWGGHSLLVMAWVEGRPFPGDVEDPGRLSFLAQQVLDVLDRLHALGIVHRDIKPGNVLVGADGRPTVLDLGAAVGQGVAWIDSQDQSSQGTLAYIAPEQLLDDAADPRSDLFALGVTLYEALSGQLPHDGPDLVGARLTADPVPLAARGVAPSRLADVVDRLVARRPEDRFEDARAAARALGATTRLRLPEGPHDASTLRAWLRGPERVSRSRTLAAETLMEASRGDPERLREELARWERAGVIDEHAEVDAFRLRALRGADRVSPLVRAALAQSEDALADAVLAEVERREGAEAVPLLKLALFPVRRRPDLVERVLDAWETAAFGIGTTTAFEALLVAIRQLGDPRLADRERLTEAGLLASRGEAARAEALLEGNGRPTAAVVRVIAARQGTEQEQERAVRDLERRSEEEPAFRGQALVARGTLMYRRLDFRRAAEQHQAAAELAATARNRAAAMMWAGAALLELPDPDGAGSLADRARELAVECDSVVHEVSTVGLLRHSAYRAGRWTAPDHELVRDLEALGVPNAAAYCVLAEAGMAWRTGDHRAAASLAAKVEALARRGRNQAVATLGWALRLMLEGADPATLDRARAEAEQVNPRGVGAQALAMLAEVPGADPAFRAACRTAAEERAWWTSAPEVPREILAPSEVRGERDLPHRREAPQPG